MGIPTFAFNIGGYIVDRNGALSCDENAGTSQLARLAAMLAERGYTAENAGDVSEIPYEAAGHGDNALAIELPREQFTDAALDNLKKIIESKAAIFKKVFGADDLPIEDVSNKLRFPWFTLTGADEVAYVNLWSSSHIKRKSLRRGFPRSKQLCSQYILIGCV